MARIRTIKPEFWQDEKLAPLDPIARLVFIGLISQADDAGRLVDNVKLLDGLLFPETDDSCADALETLARLSRVIRYRSESGQKLVQIANWEEHQRVDKPSKYTLPPPSPEDLQSAADVEHSGDTRETVARPSRSDLRPTTNDHRPDSMESDAGKEEGIPIDALWKIYLEELAGEGRLPKLNTGDRAKKLRLLWDEQLSAADDSLGLFRRICRAVKASEHHMGTRAYHLPESLFRNEERRERWVLSAEAAHGNGRDPELDEIKQAQGEVAVDG